MKSIPDPVFIWDIIGTFFVGSKFKQIVTIYLDNNTVVEEIAIVNGNVRLCSNLQNLTVNKTINLVTNVPDNA